MTVERTISPKEAVRRFFKGSMPLLADADIDAFRVCDPEGFLNVARMCADALGAFLSTDDSAPVSSPPLDSDAE